MALSLLELMARLQFFPLPTVFARLSSSQAAHRDTRWRTVNWGKLLSALLALVVFLSSWAGFPTAPAWAGLNDDRYDGDIFALYAGNGSLVPPKVSLATSQQQGRASFLVFYVDDSSDCKQYSTVISQLQAFYGRAADFIAVRVDSLPVKDRYEPTEVGYYYKGFVPQTVLIDPTGKVALDKTGKLPFEEVDDVFRQVFDLLPRSQSVTLKRRQLNEFNAELTQ